MDTCMECHGILIPKKIKMIRKTWNLAWCNVMPPSWCGKKLACLTKIWTHIPHKPEQLTRRLMVPRREQCMFDDEWQIASCYGLQKFSTCNVHWYKLSCENFGKFQGSFDLLKTFKWFSSHLLTVIQIWTRCTWNG